MKYCYVVIFVLALISCNTKTATSTDSQNSELAQTSALQLRSATDLKENGLKPGQLLIDVRTPEEIAEGKIEGALEIDFMATDFKDQIAALDKTQDYVMYCRSGGRSGKASELMVELGFKKVTNITGGFMEYNK